MNQRGATLSIGVLLQEHDVYETIVRLQIDEFMRLCRAVTLDKVIRVVV